jgi:hypothetical protein
MDIGQPADYLTGMCMYLHKQNNEVSNVGAGTEIIQPVLVVRTLSRF